MKRLIVALLVGGVMFGTVFAVAAALNVGSGTIQAGGVTDLRCDENGVGVEAGWAWSNEAEAYVVTGIMISDIDESCDYINVTLTNIDGDALETFGLGGVGTSWTTPAPTTTLLVAALEDIHVLLTSNP